MHIEDWHDDHDNRDWDELTRACEEFNNGDSYNPYGWVAWLQSDNGDVTLYVESEGGDFIARFNDSPCEELAKFMERLEEGLEW